MVQGLVAEGKNVKLIPEEPNLKKTYDFLVDGVPHELKTRNGKILILLSQKLEKH
ncbi:hypothetical protein [Listeria goaensis]|uniref:hypothetical protein n=1 Tax=Listeria goaensis TaxID=1649188 RepID=UPI0013C2C346|nr:hypothetical protein [Listeria goaensis]